MTPPLGAFNSSGLGGFRSSGLGAWAAGGAATGAMTATDFGGETAGLSDIAMRDVGGYLWIELTDAEWASDISPHAAGIIAGLAGDASVAGGFHQEILPDILTSDVVRVSDTVVRVRLAQNGDVLIDEADSPEEIAVSVPPAAVRVNGSAPSSVEITSTAALVFAEHQAWGSAFLFSTRNELVVSPMCSGSDVTINEGIFSNLGEHYRRTTASRAVFQGTVNGLGGPEAWLNYPIGFVGTGVILGRSGWPETTFIDLSTACWVEHAPGVYIRNAYAVEGSNYRFVWGIIAPQSYVGWPMPAATYTARIYPDT